MPTNNTGGITTLAQLRQRYENTPTKCPACGYVDEERNWTSRTDGQVVVYRHVCPRCDADREHTLDLKK